LAYPLTRNSLLAIIPLLSDKIKIKTRAIPDKNQMFYGYFMEAWVEDLIRSS